MSTTIDGNLNLRGMKLTPQEHAGLFTETHKASIVQNIVKPIEGELPLEGIRKFTVGKLVAKWTGEGEAKVASGTVGDFYLEPSKLTAAEVHTLEFYLSHPEIADALIATAPSVFAEKFDRTVFGLDGATGPNANFRTLAGAEVMDVADYADFLDVKAAIEDEGAKATSIVLTSAAFNRLRRLRDVRGGWEFPDLAGSAPEIEGVPVLKIQSTEVAGWTGDFLGQALWGTAVPEFVQVKNAGNITDIKGEVHNLTDSNKVAQIVETFVGFNYTDLRYFRKIAIPAAPTA